MTIHKTDNKTLVAALRIIADEIISGDGVVSSAVSEGADRIEELIVKYELAMNTLHQIAYPPKPIIGKARRTRESRHAMGTLMFLENMA